MPEKLKWSQQDGVYVLRVGVDLEALVASSGSYVEAHIVDYGTQNFRWSAEYPTLAGAKRAAVAAAKRLGLWTSGSGPEASVSTKVVRPEPKSVWEWEPELASFVSWIEGNGLDIDLVVTPMADGSCEGDVVLGTYVFRDEYPDEWSAKHGVFARAKTFIAWAA